MAAWQGASKSDARNPDHGRRTEVWMRAPWMRLQRPLADDALTIVAIGEKEDAAVVGDPA